MTATGWLRFVCATPACLGRTWAVCDVDDEEREARVLGGKPRCDRCGTRMVPDWTTGVLAALPPAALDELVGPEDVVELPDESA